MTVYAISDIHGKGRLLEPWLELLTPRLETGDRVVFCGDYIDRGAESCCVLELIYELARRFPEQVIVLRGNHEEDFLRFLDGWDEWLSVDDGLRTTQTFLTSQQVEQVEKLIWFRKQEKACAYARECLNKNHRELVAWLRGLPYYYETDRTIYVHAGVDEEAGEYWKLTTEESVFTGKFPPSKGKFLKDIVAGHISAHSASGVRSHRGIYWDGGSHYYIDGGFEFLCLGYDDVKKQYFELLPDGSRKLIFTPEERRAIDAMLRESIEKAKRGEERCISLEEFEALMEKWKEELIPPQDSDADRVEE